MRKSLLNILLTKSFLFYICYWLFFLVVFTTYRYFLFTEKFVFAPTLFRIAFLSNFAYLSLAIIGTHFIINFLLPKLYSSDKYILFSILIIVIALLSPLFAYVLAKLVVNIYIFDKPQTFTISHYISTVMKFVFCLTPLVFYKTTVHLTQKEHNQRRIETAKLESDLKLREAELKLLKGQIQPHFLFNTLNNLYSLSLQNSDKTPEVIIKLSDLLNYIIYDCRSERVKIDDEIEFIKSFIDLEKIRHDDSLKVSISIEGDFSDKYIAPMILHTFIENSFKHGANKTIGISWIDIVLIITDKTLTFKVANSKSNDSGVEAIGIGISNTKKRLMLLYPDRHKLEINETASIYSVFLELQLL